MQASVSVGGEASGVVPPAGVQSVNPTEPLTRLLRDLRTSPSGLSSREAARRLVVYGPNQLLRRGGRHLGRELGRQFAHPLALLLWAYILGRIITAAISLNAAFWYRSEERAGRAVPAPIDLEEQLAGRPPEPSV